jgi:hypothetical protein
VGDKVQALKRATGDKSGEQWVEAAIVEVRERGGAVKVPTAV